MYRLGFLFLMISLVTARDAYVSVVHTLHDAEYMRVLGRSIWVQEHASHAEPPTLLSDHFEYSRTHEQHLIDSRDRVVLICKTLLDTYPGLRDHFLNMGRWSHVISYPDYQEQESDIPSVHRDLWHLTQIFTLTQYNRVIYLSPRTFVRRSLERLFDCVGPAHDAYVRHREHDDWDWFRICAVPRELLYSSQRYRKEWVINTDVLVAIPSPRLQSDMMESARWLAASSAQSIIGQYLFWQCEGGQTGNAQETAAERIQVYDMIAQDITTNPILWRNPTDTIEIAGNDALHKVRQGEYRWPMSHCQQLPTTYGLRPWQYQQPLGEPAIVVFDERNGDWEPLQWVSWMLGGFYDEWRAFYPSLTAFEVIGINALVCCVFCLSVIELFRWMHPISTAAPLTSDQIYALQLNSWSFAQNCGLFLLMLLPSIFYYMAIFFYYPSPSLRGRTIATILPWMIGILCTTCVSFVGSSAFSDRGKLVGVFWNATFVVLFLQAFTVLLTYDAVVAVSMRIVLASMLGVITTLVAQIFTLRPLLLGFYPHESNIYRMIRGCFRNPTTHTLP